MASRGVGSHGDEAGASILVMLEVERSDSVREDAFAALDMGTSTSVLVRRVAIGLLGEFALW
jgi:hypothetical protein